MLRINLKTIIPNKDDLKYLVDNLSQARAYVSMSLADIQKAKPLNLLKIMDLNNMDIVSLSVLIREYELEKIIDKDIDEKIADTILGKILEAQKSPYKFRNINLVIQSAKQIIDRSPKKESILNAIIGSAQYLDSINKKKMIRYIAESTENIDYLNNILINFNNLISPETISLLLDKHSELANNKGIQKAISKNSKFAAYTFDQSDIQNTSNRRKLLKILAKNKTASSALRFKAIFDKDDILSLPPVMRLDFLEWFYAEKFHATYRSLTLKKPYKEILLSKDRYMYLDVVDIPVNEMGIILLPVGISKNTRMKAFLYKYNLYYDFHHNSTINNYEIRKGLSRWA